MSYKDPVAQREYWNRYWRRRRAEARVGQPTKEEAFWLKAVKMESGCWLWTRCMVRGYGHLTWNHESWLAHRLAYTLARGPIPNGLQLDHLCRVPACINPDHLEPVTNQENTRRGDNFTAVHARKTHCPRGHVYDKRTRRGRLCSICERVANRRAKKTYRLKLKVARWMLCA